MLGGGIVQACTRYKCIVLAAGVIVYMNLYIHIQPSYSCLYCNQCCEPPEPAAAERPSASATSSNSYIQSSCSHREIAPHVHTTPHHITFHSTTRAKPNYQLIRSKQTKSRARVGVE
jgi:hypothetical protein